MSETPIKIETKSDGRVDPETMSGGHSCPKPGDVEPLNHQFNETADGPQCSRSVESSDEVRFSSENRLHLATLWLPGVEMLLGVILPVLIASIFVPLGMIIFFVGCFGLLPVALYHILQFLTFRFRLSESELVLNSGAIFRRERRIPFDRVQELHIRQSLLHRIFDLAKLEITTAGSETHEATMNVLSRQDAEGLKVAIEKPCRGVDGVAPSSASNDTLPSDYVLQLTTKDLLLGGITSRLVAAVGAVMAAVLYFQFFLAIGGRWAGNLEEKIEGRVKQRIPDAAVDDVLFDNTVGRFESWMPDLGPLNFIVDFYLSDTLPKSVALVALGLIGSVIAYVVRYHGFRLTRRGDLLTTTYGWLNAQHGSLRTGRIQALKIEEGLLRRYFGLAMIRADSAGDRRQIDEAKKRDVLVPVTSRQVAQEIACQSIPGLVETDPNWNGISPKAVMRGTKKGWLLMSLVVLQTWGIAGWYCLAWLPALPLVYVLNYQWYRNTGYWLDEHHFLSRSGWLNRSTVCLPVRNIQNVSLTQSYFDRRLDLASVSIDTAGQSNTGGGPVIRNLPIMEALHIQQLLTDDRCSVGPGERTKGSY